MRTDEQRFAVDTNVLVSVLILPDSILEQGVRLILIESLLRAAAATLAELREVLMRPKFSAYISISKRFGLGQPDGR